MFFSVRSSQFSCRSARVRQLTLPRPDEQLIEAVKVALGKKFNTDWSVLDALPGIKWAPLPPRQQAINTKRKDLTLSRLASSRD